MLANIICLLINVLTNFLLPKFLSIETYAQIKTYTLYLTYAGFFSLGYNDGMYLKYGGKKLEELKKDDLADNVINYIFMIFIMNIIILSIGVIFKNFIISAFAFGMLAYNILGYFKSFYQSIGEFKLYGLSLNVEKISIFVGNLLLLFVLKCDNYRYYIILQVIVGILLAIGLYIYLVTRINIRKKGKISLNIIKENIYSGFILMIGNFTSSIFTGIDRWFIKLLMTSQFFAMYAFAVSIENIMNVFVSPITISLYNYLCKVRDDCEIKKIKSYILLWITLIISVAYPIKFILEKFLTKYTPANSIIFILLTAQIFYSIINGIYVNLYKVEKKQNEYMKQMIVMIVIAITLNILLYVIFSTTQAIAAATLITSIIWFLLCEIKNKILTFNKDEYIYIILIIVTYLFCGYCLDSITGGVVYIGTYIILSVIFMNDSLKDLIGYMKNMIIQKRNEKVQ